MDVPEGPQYAVQIAFYTLRDRCRNLQQRIALLEDENVNLRIQCSRQEETKKSLTELDFVRAQVAELTEQKGQLQDKVNMVTKENQDLWAKLGKLTRANKSLGTQLNKMNDSMLQHSVNHNITTQHSNLIRSKTFTKHELETRVLKKKIEENDKISYELEDVSLKLSDSFTKQRQEIDLICSELSNMALPTDGMNTDKCAYLLDEELREDIVEEIEKFGEYFRSLKDLVLQQQKVLQENIKNVNSLKDNIEKESLRRKKSETVESSTSTEDLPQKTFESKSTETMTGQSPVSESPPGHHDHVFPCEKICPLCSRFFDENTEQSVFEEHVHDHFTLDAEFELL